MEKLMIAIIKFKIGKIKLMPLDNLYISIYIYI